MSRKFKIGAVWAGLVAVLVVASLVIVGQHSVSYVLFQDDFWAVGNNARALCHPPNGEWDPPRPGGCASVRPSSYRDCVVRANRAIERAGYPCVALLQRVQDCEIRVLNSNGSVLCSDCVRERSLYTRYGCPRGAVW